MPRRRETPDHEPRTRLKPAATPEDRETQLISYAEQLAERQLREGTASSQVITHYLKLGSSRERLEQEKLAVEKQLLEAKKQQIVDQAKSEELFAKAIRAIGLYRGDSTLANSVLEDGEFDDPDV